MKLSSKILARFTKAQKRAFMASVAAATALCGTFFWWPTLSHFLLIENSRWTFAIYFLNFVALFRYAPGVAKSALLGMIMTSLILLCATMIYFTSNGISD